MIKYFCDRCEQEAKDSKKLRKITFYDKGQDRSRATTTFAVCPDCYEEIMAFAYGYKEKKNG
jgi:hypothetical protein